MSWRRYTTLAFMARRAKERALGNPFDQYVSDLGIPAPGKRRADKQAAIEEYFDSVEGVVVRPPPAAFSGGF